MKLRSGRSVGVAAAVAVPKESHHSMELRQNRRSVLAKFYAILHEDTNRWPNEEQACRLSTDTLDTVRFEAHIRYLMTYMVDKDTKTVMESKANRLVSMAIARSLMNVAHNDKMRTKYRRVAEVLIRKFEDVDHEVLEFDLPRFVAEFKNFM